MFIPLAALAVSTVGFHDDARYPGRLIVSARRHHTHFDEMNADELAALMSDAQIAARVLRTSPDVTRTNVAIHGNHEPHVHVHVIPRRATDAHPEKAPWDQAPPHRHLAHEDRERLLSALRAELGKLPDPVHVYA